VPLDADGYQQLVISQVGDSAGGIVAASIATLWTLHDDQPTAALQFLFAKIGAIDLLMGTVREQVTQTGLEGVKSDLSDKLKALVLMRAATVADLDRAINAGAGQDSTHAGAAGLLTTTAPISPPTGAQDANSPDYRGNPYQRRRRP